MFLLAIPTAYSAGHIWSCFCVLYRRHNQLYIYGHVFVCYADSILMQLYMYGHVFACYTDRILSDTCMVMFFCYSDGISSYTCTVMFFVCYSDGILSYTCTVIFLCAMPTVYSAIHVRSCFCVLCGWHKKRPTSRNRKFLANIKKLQGNDNRSRAPYIKDHNDKKFMRTVKNNNIHELLKICIHHIV